MNPLLHYNPFVEVDILLEKVYNVTKIIDAWNDSQDRWILNYWTTVRNSLQRQVKETLQCS